MTGDWGLAKMFPRALSSPDSKALTVRDQTKPTLPKASQVCQCGIRRKKSNRHWERIGGGSRISGSEGMDGFKKELYILQGCPNSVLRARSKPNADVPQASMDGVTPG